MEKSEAPDLLIIAGEHSGDSHAAHLVKNLRDKNPHLNIYAFGGPALEQAGAKLLCDLTKFSVVGLWEVLTHYRSLKNLLNKVYRWIKKYRPKCVCMVDFPGFNLRLAEKLHQGKISTKGGGNVRLYYYIAPQVWAWKSNRRFLMSKHLDALGVIFPFEVDFFKDTNLPVSFLGHPFMDKNLPFSYNAEGPLLLLPGSRESAVKKIFPRLLKVFECLRDWYKVDEAVVVYPDERIKEVLFKIIKKFPRCIKHISFVPFNKHTSVEASGAVMSSGTASLMVGLAGIPGIIVYKANPITYWIGRLLVKVKFLGIVNLLLNKAVYPEFLQDRFMCVEMADSLAEMLEQPEKYREDFLKYASLVKEKLSAKQIENPEDWLLKGIKS